MERLERRSADAGAHHFTFDAFRAAHPRRPGVTRRSAPAGVAWSSHRAFGSRRSRLPRGSLHTWTGFTPGRGRERLKQCRELICRGRSQRTLGHLIGWRTGGGPEELRYSLRRTSVQSLRRCWSEGDLPCNTTSRLSFLQPSPTAKKISHFLSALFFSPVFPDIPVVPVVPAARPVPRIPADPRLPFGPRLPSARQSPGAPSPHSLLSEEAGSSDGNGEFSREDGLTTGSDSEVETVARPLLQPSNWAKVTSSTSASAVKP